jgi:electron transfer flavoprotein beta subunit
VKDTVIHRFLDGKLTVEEATKLLEEEKRKISRFIIVSGIKTTDGETGSVGPQVAESLAEQMAIDFPHVTYVEDFDIDPETLKVEAERRIGTLVQKLEMNLPALLTIAPEYRPRPPNPTRQAWVRLNNYRGKILRPIKWNAEELGADTTKLGLAGSPTIVGPGVDIGKPPVQKIMGKSEVFAERIEKFVWNGTSYGPFDRGDLATSLPEELRNELRTKGKTTIFSFEMFEEELFN